MPNIATESAPCAICQYPVREPTYVGQQVKCPYCGSINEAITQVTIPTPVFVSVIFFTVGVFVGPALLAASQWGQDYLASQVRGRLK